MPRYASVWAYSPTVTTGNRGSWQPAPKYWMDNFRFARQPPRASALGFRDGQTITIDSGANAETAVIVSFRRFGAPTMTVSKPLTHAHAAGAQLSGTGITLAAGLTRAHASGALVTDHVPTPGAPNIYSRKTR